MFWIGLTGGLGTGKSTVAQMLRDRGFVVIDADEMARLALRPGSKGLAKVVNRFGPEVLESSGELNRRQLGAKVFAEAKALADLEAIVHPEVRRLTGEKRQEAQAQGHKLAFYDVPLLFEKKMQKDFDKIVVVTADRKQQIERTIARDGLSEYEIERRLFNQMPIVDKVKQAHFVIDNTGARSELAKQLDTVLAQLIKD
jgi:dephospho-CoA kinase